MVQISLKTYTRFLLKKPYVPNQFVRELIDFFRPYGLNPRNPLNLTRIIARILYMYADVKALWFETVEGLVVCDSTGWIENVRQSLTTYPKAVVWWDRQPSGRLAVQRLLAETIETKGAFYLFYSINQQAVYRARIRDFATADDYKKKNWNIDSDVAFWNPSFEDYKDDKGDGRMYSARIVFLTDQIIRLKDPIPLTEFEFYKHYQAPTQNNLQPYSEINAEIIPDHSAPTVIEEQVLELESEFSFDHEYRKILLAIKTKPFIMLAGMSGTGKSRLVRTLAYKSCALESLRDKQKPGNFELITVKPNWHDSTELLGYISRISRPAKYIVTPFVRFIVKAWRNPSVPFFLCLDEMNLAPVEQYFAEYLSLIETRKEKDGQLRTDALLTVDKIGAEVFGNLLVELDVDPSSQLFEEFIERGISLPPNLVVVGTVNMDETTHSFSRKVLDRAMTIEMNNIDLDKHLEEYDKDWSYSDSSFPLEWVCGKYTLGGQVYKKFPEADQLLKYLISVNELLENTPFKVAYRVRDELLIYCYENSSLCKDKKDYWHLKCIDEITVMKILSRIEGDEARTRVVLGKLEEKFRSGFPESHAKVKEMLSKLEQTGYTSFWS